MSEAIISVIVPVYDDNARLGLLVECLEAQTLDPAAFEVVVVDNASPTPVAATSDRIRIRVLHESKPGSYSARNRALASVDTPFVAFTDSDCQPEPGWLHAGLEALQANEGEKAAFAGDIRLFAASETPTSVEKFEILSGFPIARHVKNFHFGPTANLFAPRAAFEDGEVGLFDSDVKSGGDAKWGRAARRAGWQVRFLPGAVVMHPARRELGEFVTRTRRLAGGRAAVSRKFPAWRVAGAAVKHMIAPPVVQLTRQHLELAHERELPRSWLGETVAVALLKHYVSQAEIVRVRILGGKEERR